MVDKFLIHRKNPEQQTEKEREEDHERNHRPDGDVVDTLKNVFIHSSKVIQVVVRQVFQL